MKALRKHGVWTVAAGLCLVFVVYWSFVASDRYVSESHIVVDLTNVTFIDSSVVRALVVAHRTVLQRRGWVRAVYTHHLIRRVIDICGLDDVFPQYASVESAVRGTTAMHAHGGNELGGS